MGPEKQLHPLSQKSASEEAKTSLDTLSDPGLKAALTRLLETVKNSPLREEVDAFKKTALKHAPSHDQQIFSFLPHQLAKTSIFFPMSDKDLKEENRKINTLEVKTSWGKVTIEGVKLALFEEDIFLALLHLTKNQTQKDGENFTLKTTMPEVAKLLYKDQGYTKTVYERIERTLKRFELIRFELAVGEWKKKGKEQLKTERIISMSGLLSSHKYETETQELILRWNLDFFAYFAESMLTNINLTLRRNLKKDGSKALLRFLCAHTNPGRMHLLTVLNALNYNIDQPLFRLRSRLKEAMRELKKNRILGKNSKLFPDDTVQFELLKNDPKTQLSKL